jgi:hypothetical protein
MNKRIFIGTVVVAVIFAACLGVNAQAAGAKPGSGGSYYVNSKAEKASDSGPGSKAQPWKTLAPLNKRSFAPGDTVYFAQGSEYNGSFVTSSSGTADKPITFTAYGKGAAPRFTNPDFSLSKGNVFHVTGDYIVIDGLYFHGTADANKGVYKDALLIGAVFVAVGGDHVTIQNCEFFDCPVGANSLGLYTLITKNYIHDSNRWITNREWGPLGVIIGSAHAEISYNRFRNIYKVGGNYGADGGAIELDDRFFKQSVHDVKIHHNVSEHNYGFVEVENKVKGGNLDIYYNFSNDYQEFIFFWGGKNSRIENNTVIRTLKPLGNPPSVNTVFTMKKAGFTVRNNIFVVANKLRVWVSAPYGNKQGFASAVKENNIYYCTDGSTSDPSGVALGSGEKIGDPGFVNLKKGDYHLVPGSIAINAGQDLGYNLDLDDKPVPQGSAPDIGAYEK